MGIRLGNWDPLKLIFGILDKLLRKGIITKEEALDILRSSLPTDMSEKEKQEILESMIQSVPKKDA